MTASDGMFNRRKVRFERLLPFGFCREETACTYTTLLVDGQFTMTVTVTDDGAISADVRENQTGESYVLHRVPGSTGAFVGRVREEYEALLTTIAEACCELDVFKTEDARRCIHYFREKYQTELEFLWNRFPDNAIVRRHDNAKWYAAILTVKKDRLHLGGDEIIEVLDLRMKPDDIARLVDGKRYFPGYHMNKRHWVTLCLDGSVPAEELLQRIDESFVLAAK